MSKQTKSRKDEHIRICLDEDVEHPTSNGFDRYELQHSALPELTPERIDLKTEFLGKRFLLPFFIEAMTGGTKTGKMINSNLAKAAQELGIGMGVGSQRAMLEDPSLAETFSVRDVAPDIFLLGNIGAVQLASYSHIEIAGMVKDIRADGIAVHLNSAQELSQPEGDTDWTGVLEQIRKLCSKADFPVVIKETGCGIPGDAARMLEEAGAAALDVAGAGGTSFVKVEGHRGSDTAKAFSSWGLSTAESLKQSKKAIAIPIISSGGMRTGLDCAKSIAMGASLSGFALPLLAPAMESGIDVVKKIKLLERELRKAMMLAAAPDISSLSRKGVSDAC